MITAAEIRKVNKQHRAADDSNLWPIRGRFNVTERAIRKARWFRRESEEMFDARAYDELLDQLESEIVNDTRNW